MPVEIFFPSENPLWRSWHIAHDTVRSRDRIGSKNNSRPSAMVSAVGGLSAGNVTGGRPSGDLISTAAPMGRAGLFVELQEPESTSITAPTQTENRDIIERLSLQCHPVVKNGRIKQSLAYWCLNATESNWFPSNYGRWFASTAFRTRSRTTVCPIRYLRKD